VKRVLVTGGAGFIGANFVRMLLSRGYQVLTLDALSYAGNIDSLGEFLHHPKHHFIKLDILDDVALKESLLEFSPDWIFHLAAETHVDRSIKSSMGFLKTNVLGTANLLQAAYEYFVELTGSVKDGFRFIHISTDEVFGSVEGDGSFAEDSPYRPRSPYSASKASSDHLVRVWNHTYGLPVILTNGSNNYGPYQHPEKLIPKVITNALRGHKIPVFGQGLQVRDWIHVDDQCEALLLAAQNGKLGETYLIGGGNEWRNIDLVQTLCLLLEEEAGILPDIEFIQDRPGHDFRYSIDSSKISRELGWKPSRSFTEGLRDTVLWYLNNRPWWEKALYQDACIPASENLSHQA
jgi:dTDP-glucose 4,6-dehydratase